MRTVTRDIGVVLAIVLSSWVGSALGQRATQADRNKIEAMRRVAGSRTVQTGTLIAEQVIVRSPDGDRQITLTAKNDRATISILGPEGQVWVVVTKDRRGVSVSGRNEGTEVRIGTKTGGAPGVIVYNQGGDREEHFGTEPPPTRRPAPRPKGYTPRPEERALCQSVPGFPCKCGCADPDKPCYCDHTKNVNPESPDPKVRGDIVSPRD